MHGWQGAAIPEEGERMAFMENKASSRVVIVGQKFCSFIV
jgi:hypothetical protein